jgi:hypothetical protein
MRTDHGEGCNAEPQERLCAGHSPTCWMAVVSIGAPATPRPGCRQLVLIESAPILVIPVSQYPYRFAKSRWIVLILGMPQGVWLSPLSEGAGSPPPGDLYPVGSGWPPVCRGGAGFRSSGFRGALVVGAVFGSG